MLGQLLINKNMAKQNAPIEVDPKSAQILRFPGMASTGRYRKPIPFGGMGKRSTTPDSDHFPVAITVTID